MLETNSDSRVQNSSSTDEAAELLKSWSAERAYRMAFAMGRIGIFLGLIATAVDSFYRMPGVVIFGDTGLLLCSLVSAVLTRKRQSSSIASWLTLYTGTWLAIFTCLWVTGGIHSPFIGTFLSLLFVGGMIVQSEVSPLYVMFFIFLNLAFWSLADFLSIGFFRVVPESSFVILVNAICLLAIMACVFEFLKTEKNLSREILKRYRELARTRENLSRQEAASSAKSTFLANVSHELRTPLGAIVGYAELLQDSDLNEEERGQFTETIFRNGQALSRLVNDLLDLSKIEAGRVEIEKLPIHPQVLLAEVINLLAFSAQKKNIELRLVHSELLPKSMISDPLRFKQIVTNLVNNAIKFTDRGFVEIRVSVSHEALQIEVVDSGRGLTEEEKLRLFKPFSQADASITRQFGGTGLGLNLSMSLAKLLGGELKLAWSKLGEGSCFVFIHPLSEIQNQSKKNPLENVSEEKHDFMI